MTYPKVLTEDETLDLVLAGRSLSRWGDGEFKIACNSASIKSQPYDRALQKRLMGALREPGDCIVGIPNIDAPTPKADFWERYRWTERHLPVQEYGSSFVTRPDSAPWIDRPDYWAKVESLWLGRPVTLVRGSGKSLTAEDLMGAGEVTEIIGPRQGAWSDYSALLKRIGRPERALLCLGPTATVMAVDLCARGVHAIDLGHIGMFLRKHRRGEPMWVTKQDKEAV